MIEFLVVRNTDAREWLIVNFPVVPVAGDLMYLPDVSGAYEVKRRVLDLTTGRIKLIVGYH